ncbi:hypothetical protein [Sharpea azabuensis]|uniref:hypothetical protein n=1 Tax=Sharpea azabuensis TaxID=322505 RepID=UPI001567EA03|nr:hypothetical protein [Sharpea azabuensis]
MFVWNRSPGKEKRSKRENKNIFVFSFFYIKQLKICWKGPIMEDIKINNDKLNEAIKRNDLPEVPRTIEGKIDLEAIAIGKNEKDNYIVPDEILKAYYKELPNGTTNETRSAWSYNGGLLNKADKEVQRAGGKALQAKIEQRRTIQETVKYMLAQAAKIEDIEQYGLEAGATKQDALVAAMLMKAIERGDVQAGAFIRDTAGEKPTEKIAAEVETITPEDRKQIERILNRTKTQDVVVDGN